MTQNILFYFFSTTAQVFGAILGVLGLFTVFRIENIRNRILQDTPRIWYLIGDFDIFPEEMPSHSFSIANKQNIREKFPYQTNALFKKIMEIEKQIYDKKKYIEEMTDQIIKLKENGEKGPVIEGRESNIKVNKREVFQRESALQQIKDLEKLIVKDKDILKSIKCPAYVMALIIAISLLGILFSVMFEKHWFSILIVVVVLLLSCFSLIKSIKFIIMDHQ